MFKSKVDSGIGCHTLEYGRVLILCEYFILLFYIKSQDNKVASTKLLLHLHEHVVHNSQKNKFEILKSMRDASCDFAWILIPRV